MSTPQPYVVGNGCSTSTRLLRYVGDFHRQVPGANSMRITPSHKSPTSRWRCQVSSLPTGWDRWNTRPAGVLPLSGLEVKADTSPFPLVLIYSASKGQSMRQYPSSKLRTRSSLIPIISMAGTLAHTIGRCPMVSLWMNGGMLLNFVSPRNGKCPGKGIYVEPPICLWPDNGGSVTCASSATQGNARHYLVQLARQLNFH